MIDVELTNRCNADCGFCPRRATPRQGTMSDETFETVVGRVLELRRHLVDQRGYFDHGVSFCGLGDALVHPRVVDHVARIRSEDLLCQLNTNGAGLTPAIIDGLLDAGLNQIRLNVGALGDDYEAIYGLPFERTRRRVCDLRAAADGRCEVVVVLVGGAGEEDRLDEVEAFWRFHGFRAFHRPTFMNRGGALESFPDLGRARWARRAAEDLFDSRGGRPLCAAPFLSMFVGYDGFYYLCSSDWKKEASCGHVASDSFMTALDRRYQHVVDARSPCTTCSFDPTFQVAAAMHEGSDAGAARADLLIEQWDAVERSLGELAVDRPPPNKRLGRHSPVVLRRGVARRGP